jgi:hypothetical protein
MLDECSETGGILGKVCYFQAKKRSAAATGFDLRSETEFAVESGINGAPIGKGHMAVFLDAVDEQDRSAAFAAECFSDDLGDEFVRDVAGKAG